VNRFLWEAAGREQIEYILYNNKKKGGDLCVRTINPQNPSNELISKSEGMTLPAT
jgi:hypothetical protein